MSLRVQSKTTFIKAMWCSDSNPAFSVKIPSIFSASNQVRVLWPVVNLKDIIEILKSKRIESSKILLVPPPPCNEEMWRKALELKSNTKVERSPKNNATTRQYFDACLQVAEKAKCKSLTDPNHYWNSLDSKVNYCDS